MACRRAGRHGRRDGCSAAAFRLRGGNASVNGYASWSDAIILPFAGDVRLTFGIHATLQVSKPADQLPFGPSATVGFLANGSGSSNQGAYYGVWTPLQGVGRFDSGAPMPSPVPEPSSLLVWSALAAAGLGTAWRRRTCGARPG